MGLSQMTLPVRGRGERSRTIARMPSHPFDSAQGDPVTGTKLCHL